MNLGNQREVTIPPKYGIEEIIGKRFGILTIVGLVKEGKKRILCKCDCGNTKEVYLTDLTKGTTRSCGCLQISKTKNKLQSIIGKKFGKLTVKSVAHKENRHSFMNCLCDCGNSCVRRIDCIIKGTCNSCGCLKQETDKTNLKLGKSTKDSSFNSIFLSYKGGADKRGLKFELTKEQFKSMIVRDCNYCGRHPYTIFQSKSNHPPIVYNGIDRVDSSKGYTLDNCVTCCKYCNRAKSDLSIEDFKSLIILLYNKFFNN